MSDGAGGVRAKYLGGVRRRYAKEPDPATGERAVLDEAPAEYVQWRDEETGEVANIPAGDLSDEAWDALPAAGRKAVRESPLYAVPSEKEHAERRRERARGGAAPAAAAEAVKEG
jgi:hypothetical protein